MIVGKGREIPLVELHCIVGHFVGANEVDSDDDAGNSLGFGRTRRIRTSG